MSGVAIVRDVGAADMTFEEFEVAKRNPAKKSGYDLIGRSVQPSRPNANEFFAYFSHGEAVPFGPRRATAIEALRDRYDYERGVAVLGTAITGRKKPLDLDAYLGRLMDDYGKRGPTEPIHVPAHTKHPKQQRVIDASKVRLRPGDEFKHGDVREAEVLMFFAQHLAAEHRGVVLKKNRLVIPSDIGEAFEELFDYYGVPYKSRNSSLASVA
jgi:hypothetical protein